MPACVCSNALLTAASRWTIASCIQNKSTKAAAAAAAAAEANTNNAAVALSYQVGTKVFQQALHDHCSLKMLGFHKPVPTPWPADPD
eukprot:676193-Pelagomonas_calceolata.AAC.2